MPTGYNRGFYCRLYCLLNMIRAPLCPSSGDQEFYTVVAACGIGCCGFSSCWSGVELRVMCRVCRMLQHRSVTYILLKNKGIVHLVGNLKKSIQAESTAPSAGINELSRIWNESVMPQSAGND